MTITTVRNMLNKVRSMLRKFVGCITFAEEITSCDKGQIRAARGHELLKGIKERMATKF